MLPLVVVKLHNYTQILPKKEDLRIAFQMLFRYSGIEFSSQLV